VRGLLNSPAVNIHGRYTLNNVYASDASPASDRKPDVRLPDVPGASHGPWYNLFEKREYMDLNYGRRNSFRLALGAVFALAFPPIEGHAQDSGTLTQSEPRCEGNISLRLFVTQTFVYVGHSVPLRVELKNCGQKTLWTAIANETNFGFPANLQLFVRDQHRRRVLPDGYSILGASGTPGEWWIPLPPGYLYGRDVIVTRYISAFVKMPGKYEVTVLYSGIPRPAPSSKFDRKSPTVPPEGDEVFTGRAESNPIVIEIVAPAADTR
jgi:hypothetical protein